MIQVSKMPLHFINGRTKTSANFIRPNDSGIIIIEFKPYYCENILEILDHNLNHIQLTLSVS